MLATALACYRRFYAQDRAGQLLALAAAGATVPLYVVLALLFERVARPGGEVWTAGLLLIVVAALILALEMLMDVWGISATLYRPMRRVQLGVFDRFLRLPPRRYPDVPSAAVSAATIQYLDGTFFLRDGLRLTHSLLCALALGVVIAWSSVWLGLIATLPVLVMGIVGYLLRRQLISIDTNERKARSRLDTFITDTLHGVLTVKLCGSEAASARHLARLSADHQYRWLLVKLQDYGVPTLNSSLAFLVIPAFLAVGGYLIATGTMTAAQLLSSYVILNIISYHLYQVNGQASYVLSNLRNIGHITEFLAGDTDGQDTVEVVRGAVNYRISGGEKARLCLARALLMDRPILLLDEVTAQIDAAREREILTTLLHDTPGTTVIAISHRLSSVRDFPRIILLDGGRIADQGTHNELLGRCHRYRELFGLQIAG